MSKGEFIRKYKALGKYDRASVKSHWEGVYKNALFPETFDHAERVLLWIREAENNG